MGEVTNQTLAVLLVVAIVASIGGSVFLVSRMQPTTMGAATGIAKVNVTSMVVISLPASVVDFGDLYQGASANTTTNSPAPLTVQNDGTVFVNVSIERDALSQALFSGTGGGDNTASFRFKIANSTEPGSFSEALSYTSWTNVPGTVGINNVIANLNYSDATDLVEVELLINVPTDEPIGAKNETLVFTAIQA